MRKAFEPKREGKKLVYAARNIRVVPASEIWPTRTDTAGVEVLVGECYHHDQWFPLRSSKVVHISGADHETLNSIYRSIDL